MKIVCFGDSNTYGFDPRSYFGGRYPASRRWVDILAAKDNWELENYGENGRCIPNSDYETELYDKIFSQLSPDLLLIMLGSNDLLQGLSAKAAAVRMTRFLSKLSIKKGKILLISPPPFTDGLWVPDEKTIEHSSLLGQFYSESSGKLGTHFIDTGSWNIPLCYDGVHFTENGHKIFAEKIYNKILSIKEK